MDTVAASAPKCHDTCHENFANDCTTTPPDALADLTPVQVAAVEYCADKLAICNVDPAEKSVTYSGWQLGGTPPNQIGPKHNIGIVCGQVSAPTGHSLVCVDVDDAQALALAPDFLPPTGMSDGRPSKPRAHWWYLVPTNTIPEWLRSKAPKTAPMMLARYGHPGMTGTYFTRPKSGKHVIDFKASGSQAVAPPSIHESGEVREWEGGKRGTPTVVDALALWRAVCDLAAACDCRPPTKTASAKRPKKAAATVAVPTAPATPNDDTDDDTEDDDQLHYLCGVNPHALSGDALTVAEKRARANLNAIPDADLPIDGEGGDATTVKILGALVYGFQLPRDLVIRVFVDHVNSRLVPPNKPWTEPAIAYKVDWLIFRGPDERFPVGELLKNRPMTSTRSRPRQDAGVGADAKLVFSSLAGVIPKPLTFLVPGFIPSGMLGMIAGEGGHGKSLITLDLIAAITTGKCPLGLDYPDGVVGSCILIACEDDWERTIVPRLLALGADLSKVYRIDGLKLTDGGVLDFDLSHAKQLREMVEKIGDVKLIVIDPAGAFVGRAGVDEHKDAELRSLLGPLSELANETGATVLMVKHLNKNVGVAAVQRVGGSAGYVNAVRFSYIVTPDRDDATRKLFIPLKANVLPGDLKGRAYRINVAPLDAAHSLLGNKFPDLKPDDRETIAKQLVRTTWEPEPIDIDANAATAAPGGRRPAGQLDACKVIIRDFLGAHSRPVAELDSAAGRAFPAKVVKEAKKQLRELPAGNPDKLWTRPLNEGGKWWAWVGPDGNPRPPHPDDAPAVCPSTGSPDQTDGTDETAQAAQTAPQGGEV
ncbi:AAA family ATPase [Urbifossiella limnaea]|uniref:DNA primase/polymerase bifunctional N-terminal domain-containing protein n=1 Tax=Urbifossiella limnaea TaxID=2528023 RepID=A0A517XPP9_9BACT|nr:AAA family ATPase [Urbifossiella limnaea]QDU19485.1 hypothetical protein ETAA1_14120 [Urbifossiella limnaea]